MGFTRRKTASAFFCNYESSDGSSKLGVFLTLAFMHRLTAKLVLLSLLLSIFAPAALAIVAPAPHACCMRKMHGHSSHEAAFQAASCCEHDCCNSLTSTHAAQAPALASFFCHSEERSAQPSIVQFHVAVVSVSHSGRSPPSFSLS
jgi:hypothetical protein